MAELQCRHIEQNGTQAWLRVYWGNKDCPNCYGTGNPGVHNARIFLTETDTPEDWDLGGSPDHYPDDRWPTKCGHCQAPVPVDKLDPELPYGEQVHRQVHRKRRYNTESGLPEPGDMYWTNWMQVPKQDGEGTECSCTWDNCEGRHLYVMLPNGVEWNADGRASNCTMKDDKTHRCWVRVGEPPNVHVSKTGHTCAAGAGSIAAPGWHGFLRHGKLVG